MSLISAGSILLDITFKEGQNGPELKKKEIFNKLDESLKSYPAGA